MDTLVKERRYVSLCMSTYIQCKRTYTRVCWFLVSFLFFSQKKKLYIQQSEIFYEEISGSPLGTSQVSSGAETERERERETEEKTSGLKKEGLYTSLCSGLCVKLSTVSQVQISLLSCFVLLNARSCGSSSEFSLLWVKKTPLQTGQLLHVVLMRY